MIKKKNFIVFLIWVFAGIIIFLLNFTKIPLDSKYKIIEGNISDIKCIHPTKDYYLGEIKLFYDKNKKYIKFKSPILEWSNFDEKCKILKEQIHIGQYLKATIYDKLVGSVYIDNKKIQDGKK